MVTTVGPDGEEGQDLFSNAGPKPLDRIDFDSGAWLAPNEATRQALRTSYIAWLDAGRPAKWPLEPEDPAAVAERNRSLRERVIEKATGVKVKIVDRYSRPPETVEAPPSFDEDGEWVDMPSTRPVESPQAAESLEVAPDSALVSEEALAREHDRQAAKWSRGKGLPLHKKGRPSQTPEGRRKRYLRLMAERENTTIQQAGKNHPKRGPQPKKPTKE